MGARSYIPQLGRFLQPDPQPGGSANAYTYTHDNPLNETDLSGNWTLNQTSGGVTAVGTGTGTQLEGGTGIAEGAIMPAPVNLQIEDAFIADPPGTKQQPETKNTKNTKKNGGKKKAKNTNTPPCIMIRNRLRKEPRRKVACSISP